MDEKLSVKERLDRAIEEIKKQLPEMEVREWEQMKNHCSFRSGGPARALIVPGDLSEMTKVFCLLKENHLAPYILGNGTNVVFPDSGTKELAVVSTEKLQKIFLLEDGAVYAEAGVSLSRLAGFAYEHGLSGLEFASGIPGTVGGGVLMNAGAYGGEMKDVVESVVFCYLPDQSLYELTCEQCAFGYRKSYFQSMPGCVILSSVFRLKPGEKSTISEKMKELNGRRREKQPLDLPSAGSAFRRPDGYYAAALIEECGLKGVSIGGAQVSEKHAGFIVNTGDAASKDLYDLMIYVRKTVYEQKHVQLEPEIILLPEDYRLEDNGPQVRRNTASSAVIDIEE